MSRDCADDHKCPVCLVALEPSDVCATDYEMGICHAACLADAPIVDLETGLPAPAGAEVDTYLFSEVCDDCRLRSPMERERDGYH